MLRPTALPLLLAVASALALSAAPAGAATFSEPRTIAGWGRGGELLVAAPGAAAWAQPGAVWLRAGGGDAARVFGGDGLLGQVRLATKGGASPVVAWTDEAHRIHGRAAGGHEVVDAGATRVRALAVTPTMAAWIRDAAGGEPRLELATVSGEGFGPAHAPEQLGRPSHGLVAAGDGERSLLVWHAQDVAVRRVQMLAVDAAGRSEGSRWLTGADGDATSPDVDMDPRGSAVVAWIEGMPLGRVVAAPVAPDGTVGERRVLSEPGAGAPDVAVGRDGTAVVAWLDLQTGAVRAAVRRPGETFAAATSFPVASFQGIAAAVTDRGDAIVAWGDAEPRAHPRDGARLQVAVAPAGAGFGAPAAIAEHALVIAAAGDAVTWTEARPLNAVESERRVRTARLTDAVADSPAGSPGEPGRAADRRRPRVTLRVLARRGGRVRVSVRSDERATLRAAWRSGRRVLGRSRARLRPHRAVTIRFVPSSSLRRMTLTVKVADVAGNARTILRRLRVR